MQNDGRADAALAAWNVCHDSADGIDTHRPAKPVGPGHHHTMAAAIRIQQAMRIQIIGVDTAQPRNGV